MGQQKEPTTNEKQIVALGRTLQTLRDADNADAMIEIALNYLHETCDYTLVWIGLYDRMEHRLIGKGGVTPISDSSFLKQRFTLTPGDILEQVVIQQRPLAIADLREEIRAGDWRKAAQRFNIQGTILFPIRYKDRCLGVALFGASYWGVSPRSDEKARLAVILGELAAGLYQIETDWQRQQIKRPDEPLMALLAQMRSLTTLNERLDVVAEATHKFIEPSRTNIYWFEREQRYFWRRSGNQISKAKAAEMVTTITAQEVSGFYQALAGDQMVAIGESQSTLKGDMTSRLMQQIKARSLLAAPILLKSELLGFVAVEGNEPRIWKDEEKNYVRGVANLIALTAPLEEMEVTVQQTLKDQALTAEVAKAIYSDDDWKKTLKTCGDRLCDRLKGERLLVLLYDKDLRHFEVCHQSQPSNRKPVPDILRDLDEVDWQMLERSDQAIGLENLDEDLKLMAWRQVFLDLGVRSILVCNTTPYRPAEGILILCHEAPRTWSPTERNLMQVVGQQVGVILHQWQLQRQADQQQKTYQTVQWALTSIQQIHQLDRVELISLQHIAQILQVPLAVLVTWPPGRANGRIITPPSNSKGFTVNPQVQLSIHTDSLVQWTLQTDGLLPLTVDHIPPDTRLWLNGPEIGQVLALALRTSPDHEPTGIVIVADQMSRYWSDRHLQALGTLTSQLAWSRRYTILTETLRLQRERLERLNWYKQRRIEEINRMLATGVKRLNELNNQPEGLASMYYQQLLRQLGDTLTSTTQLLKDEQWRLRAYQETAPLAGLLKRALDRIEPLFKQRQLWTQVHNNEGNLTISGDIVKIEFVLHELFVAACLRCQAGGRLDLWCRTLDQRWLELSLTDNGVIEPRLVADLQNGRGLDLLAPSTLDQPPGLHLAICQSIMQQMGGELNLYKLEDERVLSRLVLPLATPAAMNFANAADAGKTTRFF